MENDLITLAPLAGLLLAAGAFAGIVAGLLGIGGGLVLVPVLFTILGQVGVADSVRIKVAVGTSLATIVATAWSSARAHWRQGNVDTAFLKSYGPVIVSGVLAGSAMATHLRGPLLTAIFAIVACVLAGQIALGNPDWKLGDRLPGGIGRLLIGGTIGMLSALMGIGGGTMTVPVMTMYGTSVHRAVGTAAAMGFIIGVPGALGFIAGGWGNPDLPPYSLGFVSLVGLALIVPTSAACAPFGARLALRLDRMVLRRVFALFLAITAARMVHSIFF
ncbi:MAG: sulfite exporter TauE/SafE family protein [Alphaproteobacteria bacterium]|nr:sulfite exporter TauE/SafE family protein [Alphaproteobacteria bacterium]